ncbi:MAG TPA: Gfo/Idh/MocA family oxidoreductase [Anaerolineales bacterium]|nr:Gfo/Idh/MocA family oxidoreductase [Anaerolineales bacterium]
MKTVVLGAGRMGRRHIQVVKELGLDLVGICDSNPEALALAEKEQGVRAELHYSDVASLLQAIRPACVIVATTAPTHSAYTCLAAESGAKYILCEKPMAVSLAECDRMLEICQQHGTRLAINHQMRFMEQYTETKRIINSEAFGGLTSITVVAGNFGMAMNGTHYFEMLRYMADEAPDEVAAWFSAEKVPNPRGPQFEDRAGSVRMTTPSGKRFYMEIGSDQGHGVKVIYAGKYGQIVVDELSGAMTMVRREDEYRSLPTTRYGMPAVYSTQAIKPADALAPSRSVLEALLNGENPPSGEDGRLALQVLVAAYLSNEQEHRSVRIAETNSCRERVFPWA